MKRTKYMVCCQQTSTGSIWRRVMSDGENYYIKWKGKLVDVTEDIKKGSYIIQ